MNGYHVEVWTVHFGSVVDKSLIISGPQFFYLQNNEIRRNNLDLAYICLAGCYGAIGTLCVLKKSDNKRKGNFPEHRYAGMCLVTVRKCGQEVGRL